MFTWTSGTPGGRSSRTPRIGRNTNTNQPRNSMLPQYVQDGIEKVPEPPSYNEAMGGNFTTTVSQTQEDCAPLAHVDVMPRCLKPGNMSGRVPPQFDTLTSVIESCNHWLQQNPSYYVWKCETFERKFEKDGSIDMQTTVHMEGRSSLNVTVIGIRMWLTPNMDIKSPPQQLGLMNIVPDYITVDLYYQRLRSRYPWLANDGGGGESLGMLTAFQVRPHVRQVFAGIDATVEKLNSNIKETPLQGYVLSMEIATLKAFDGTMQVGELDPDSSMIVTDGKASTRRYTRILRLYFVLGDMTSQEEIGTAVFTPDILAQPEGFTPAMFADFENTTRNAAAWLKTQNDLRVVSISTERTRLIEMIGPRSQVTLDTDTTEEFEMFNSTNSGKFLQSIRIVYAKSPTSSLYPGPGVDLSCRTFVPARLGFKTFESLSQTVYRIEAWLRIAGLQIFGVESYQVLADLDLPSGRVADTNRSAFILRHGGYWITLFRIYFHSNFQEPDPQLLPPQPQYFPEESSVCNVL